MTYRPCWDVPSKVGGDLRRETTNHTDDTNYHTGKCVESRFPPLVRSVRRRLPNRTIPATRSLRLSCNSCDSWSPSSALWADVNCSQAPLRPAALREVFRFGGVLDRSTLERPHYVRFTTLVTSSGSIRPPEIPQQRQVDSPVVSWRP